MARSRCPGNAASRSSFFPFFPFFVPSLDYTRLGSARNPCLFCAFPLAASRSNIYERTPLFASCSADFSPLFSSLSLESRRSFPLLASSASNFLFLIRARASPSRHRRRRANSPRPSLESLARDPLQWDIVISYIVLAPTPLSSTSPLPLRNATHKVARHFVRDIAFSSSCHLSSFATSYPARIYYPASAQFCAFASLCRELRMKRTKHESLAH